MVQPFGNIPQLNNPGVAPAISGIASGIGNLLQLKQGRERNTQDLVNQLLQNQGAMARQKLVNEGKAQTGQSSLQSLRMIDLLQRIGQGQISSNVDPTTGRQAISTAQSLVAAMLGNGQIPPMTGVQQQTPQQIPQQGQAQTQQSFQQQEQIPVESPLPSLPIPTAAPLNPTVDQLNTFGGFEPVQAETQNIPQGQEFAQQVPKFSFGAEQEAPMSPFERKQRADAATAESESNRKGFEAKFTSPDYLYGFGSKSLQDTIQMARQGTPYPAIDISSMPLGEDMDEYLITNRAAYTNLTPERKSEVLQKISTAPSTINNLVDAGLEFIEKRQSGTLNRQRLKLIAETGGLGLDNLNPDEEAVIVLIDQLAPAVIAAAAADQGPNSISNVDAGSFRKALGDPTSSFEVFQNNFSRFIAKSYLSGLKNAANVNAIAYNELKRDLEQLSGVKFTTKDFNDVNKFSKAIRDNFKNIRANKLKKNLGGEDQSFLDDIDSLTGGF